LPAELLIAPAASGKTEACIQRIRDNQAANPLKKIWVVVPDRIQAAAFRGRLAESGGAIGIQIGRFEDLNRSLLEDTGTLLPVASFSLQHRFIQDTVDSATALGKLPHFSPLQPFPGFIQSLRESFAELKRALVNPSQLFEYAQDHSPAYKDLAELFSRYQSRLGELQWADTEDLNWLAITALEQNKTIAKDIRLIIVDGFDSFDSAQIEVLKLLSQRGGDTLITIPGMQDSIRPAFRRFTENIKKLIGALSPIITTLENTPFLTPEMGWIESCLFEPQKGVARPVSEPILLEARSPADEAREALRWIKTLVVRKNVPLTSCAIFTPDPATYHPFLKISAEEFGIPIQFTLDESLDSSPSITALINLLSLPVKNFSSRYLVNILRSPYFDFSLDKETINTLEMISRVAQIVEGWEQWQEAWDRLSSSTHQDQNDLDDERNSPKLPRGSEADQLCQTLKSVFQTLTPPEQVLSQTEWITWLEDVLEQLQFYEKASSERDQAACEVLREVLRSLVLNESVAGERQVSYPQFLADIQGTLRGEGLRESGRFKQPALLVGRMTEARGTRFKAVVIMGLSEGSFPVVERTDPFLDEDFRSAVGLDSRLRREQAGVFYQAVTRADQYLLLTRPYLAGDGERWEPSIFWSAVKTLFNESAVKTIQPDHPQLLADAASTQELLFSAVQQKLLPGKYRFLSERWQNLQQTQEVLKARRSKGIQGPYEGYVPALMPSLSQRYSTSTIWSASRLENYGSCPFQFFVRNALDLEPRELPKLGFDARQLGSMLHKILEETYKNARNTNEESEVLKILEQETEKVFHNAPRDFGFRPSLLWEVEKAQLLEKLKQTVRELAKQSTTWAPIAFEEEFGIHGKKPLIIDLGEEKIKIRGVIDRIDQNKEGQLRVLDYKSGGSHLAKSDLEKGYRLQLPIYALAARDALNLGIPVEGKYWNILAAKAGSLILSDLGNKDMDGVEASIDIVREHLRRIIKGIHAAEFSPASPSGGCPSYCPAAAWCWRYESSW